MAKKRKKVKMKVIGRKGHGRTYHSKSKDIKDFGKNKNFVTLDELKDKTLGKVGTKERDKFDKKVKKDIEKDLRKVKKK